MKPRVRLCSANHLEYPFNAVVFIPCDDRKDTSRFIGLRYVEWYHTVRSTTLEGLYRGITEALQYAPTA